MRTRLASFSASSPCSRCPRSSGESRPSSRARAHRRAPISPLATADPPQHDGLGCDGRVRDRAAPRVEADKERKPPRAAPRQGGGSAIGGTTDLHRRLRDRHDREPRRGHRPGRDEARAQGVPDVVGAIPPLARVIPVDRLDEVEERLGRIVDGPRRRRGPVEAPDVPTEILEDALVPDASRRRPRSRSSSIPRRSRRPPFPTRRRPPAPRPSPFRIRTRRTRRLRTHRSSPRCSSLDEETAEKLGIPRRMTITLSPQVMRALAILSERNGLELSATAADSAAPSRD